ncbi:MAG: hypothetical protein H9872_09150 [Candidatus Cellulosilyticum pullistercoris]|uniref:Uncharacterized protein n=1 Tax=Candidatus Cellulosilyticum pullistercoris TaxID=2838521 RepID=A0A9E2NM18_9FIRM|nr:hypothetical protein [Candidatus Cellulosilyticum pullistercoris]
MKKIIICLMLLLTGCQSVDHAMNTDKMKHSITVNSQIEETVTYIEDDEWKILEEELERADAWWYYINNFNLEYLTDNGIALVDGIFIEDINAEQSKKAIELIGAKLGKAFEDFIRSADTLETMEHGEIKETILGNYGVVLQKVKNSVYERVDLYICQSNLMLKSEKERAWVEEICGNDVLLSAVSQGAEGRLLELSMPSYVMYEHLYGTPNISAYYQVFKENYGDVRKIRMVLNQGENVESKLPENQGAVLKRLISSASDEEVEVSDLIKAIESRLSGNSGVKKGTVGKLNYSITKEGNLVIVELDRN